MPHPSRASSAHAQCRGFTGEHRRCRLIRAPHSAFCTIHRNYPATFLALFKKAEAQYPVWFTKREQAELDFILKFRVVPLKETDISPYATPYFVNYLFKHVCLPDDWITRHGLRYLFRTQHATLTLEDLDTLLTYRDHEQLPTVVLMKLMMEDIEDTFFRPLTRKDSFVALLQHPFFRGRYIRDRQSVLELLQLSKPDICMILWRMVVQPFADENDQETWETHIWSHLHLLSLPKAEAEAKNAHLSNQSPFKEALLTR